MQSRRFYPSALVVPVYVDYYIIEGENEIKYIQDLIKENCYIHHRLFYKRSGGNYGQRAVSPIQ